ncbi:MAG: hypothetical protein ACTSW1_00240 [Candidatus Hodarchaeales archaeon]
MSKKYSDFIRFEDVIGVRSKYCKIINYHDGLFYVEIAGKEHIIPKNSVILIIRDARGEK